MDPDPDLKGPDPDTRAEEPEFGVQVVLMYRTATGCRKEGEVGKVSGVNVGVVGESGSAPASSEHHDAFCDKGAAIEVTELTEEALDKPDTELICRSPKGSSDVGDCAQLLLFVIPVSLLNIEPKRLFGSPPLLFCAPFIFSLILLAKYTCRVPLLVLLRDCAERCLSALSHWDSMTDSGIVSEGGRGLPGSIDGSYP